MASGWIGRLVLALCYALSAVAVAAPPKAAPMRLEFRHVPVSEFVSTMYSQVLGVDHVLDAEFLAHPARVSVDVRGKDAAAVRRLVRVELQAAGFEEVEAGGVVRVQRRAVLEPLTYVYAPRYRSVSYLVEVAGLVVRGDFSTERMVPPAPGHELSTTPPEGQSPTSAAGLQDRGGDVLLFRGEPIQVQRLESLLPQLDRPQGQVLVRGAIYEVRLEQRHSSALQLIGELLKGRIGIDFGSAVAGDRLTIRSGDLTAVLSLLGQDTRFKSISSPQLRVVSGQSATVSVGAEVPVLGQLTFDNQGRPVQSVEYRQSGVILTLTPRVYRDAVDLDVQQEVSSFVSTQTGVNNSPTLLKRSVATRVSMGNGDVVLLGGLEQTGETKEERGPRWLPRPLKAKGRIDEQTELVVLLGVEVL